MLLLGFLLTFVVVSNAIPFEDCGDGSVKEVNIDICPGFEPCFVRRGSTVKIEAILEPKIPAESVRTTRTAIVEGKYLSLPDDSANACAEGKISPPCPLQAGKTYRYSSFLTVKSAFPIGFTKFLYQGINELGQIISCGTVGVTITE